MQKLKAMSERYIVEGTMNAETKLVRTTAKTAIDYSTETLFKDRKTLTIEHRGETYLLRITRNDKLILTK